MKGFAGGFFIGACLSCTFIRGSIIVDLLCGVIMGIIGVVVENKRG